MMSRSLSLLLMVGVLGFACEQTALALNVLTPGDPIIAIDEDSYSSLNSSYPAGETPYYLFDDLYMEADATKYLNFGELNTGFIIQPQSSSVIQSFRLATANDASERDPMSYVLYGTNDSIASTDNSAGNLESWELISEGDLSLTEDRYTFSDAYTFSNTTSYSAYRMIFPTVRNSAAANSMQLGEVELLNSSGVDITTSPNLVLAVQEAEYSSYSGYPALENPPLAIDGDITTKYLNTDGPNSGFIVTPSRGSSVVEGFRVTTANDLPERDPSSWVLYGTNDEITSEDNSVGDKEDWVLIDQGTLSLPDNRFAAGSVVQVDNASNTAYTSYKMVFPTLKGNNNLMQIAEFELFEDDAATVVIDRATGAVSIRAESTVTIGSYEIASATFGTLDASQWTPIATAGTDPDDTWVVDAQSQSTGIAEGMTAGGAGNGLTITAGNSVNLGDLFLLTPYDDIRVLIYDESGELISQSVEMTGNAIIAGDYDYNGSINFDDYQIFLEGFGGYYPNLSPAEAYLLGDLDGDLDSDIEDFILLARAAGGIDALMAPTSVPEPSSIVMLVLAGAAAVGYRSRRWMAATLLFGLVACFTASDAMAVSYSNLGTPSGEFGIQASETARYEGGEYKIADYLFDDEFLDVYGVDSELFNFNYNNPDPEVVVGSQYVSVGATPKTLFFDYGSTVSSNSFAWAQRSGAIPDADRVGSFEFWFSDTPFGASNNETPATEPDSVFALDGDDARALDSYIRPYPLNNDYSFQYVAMRITVAEVSAENGNTNIGGSEFRMLSGPSPVVLEVNRGTGEMTLRNNGSNAQSFNLRAIEIESQSGSLDSTEFDGLGGKAGFPASNWTVGGGSDDYLITESQFNGTSTLAAGASISLGVGYNVYIGAEDLSLRFAEESLGDYDFVSDSYGVPHLFDGVVRYVGVAPTGDFGDFNADGVVDLGDYTVWRDNLGGNASTLNNNGTGGTVSMADYDLWKAKFGTVYSGGAVATTAVPEPAALALLVGALGLTMIRKRLAAKV
ncbi:PEP-CTERM sorting domain-containing protein [Aeoliella mucimassa]|uniref:PEP-CTERM motif protein n=1 Tax=Aeoliella mucimassa TaxID=2527972 RepID=A0A518AMZ7_9BACT|nr:PEP-CTERM sorting domain-containing protein [Aeoliella mucimassa]QDU56105.1 hypothetical protein Pan181_23090 [Aeoliella mucimassa]